MQKVINVIAILSGLVSAGAVAGATYAYLQKDALIESAKQQITKAVTESVTSALPGMIDKAVPELPSATGGVIAPTTTGLPKL